MSKIIMSIDPALGDDYGCECLARFNDDGTFEIIRVRYFKKKK